VNLNLLLIFENVSRHVFSIKKLSISELINACFDKYEFIIPLEGTIFYIVKSRDYRHGFINVTDISTYMYCSRKLYIAYNMRKFLTKIKYGKIVEKLREKIDYLRDGGVVYDRDTLRKILVGSMIHKCLENSVKFVNVEEIETEKKLIDLELGIIGHVDVVHYVNDSEVEIYEFKSGLFTRPYESHVKQVQMYAFLVEKLLNQKVSKVYIVNPKIEDVHSKPLFNVHEVPYSTSVKSELISIVKNAREVLLRDRAPKLKYDPLRCQKCTYKILCIY
jgi:CRISPR/Cas system-associated exonuclease Cas4 (RecB family)